MIGRSCGAKEFAVGLGLAAGLFVAPALAQSQAQEGSALLPPNAKPGECYARVLVPEQYQTTTQRVLKREGSEDVEIVPKKTMIARASNTAPVAAMTISTLLTSRNLRVRAIGIPEGH